MELLHCIRDGRNYIMTVSYYDKYFQRATIIVQKLREDGPETTFAATCGCIICTFPDGVNSTVWVDNGNPYDGPVLELVIPVITKVLQENPGINDVSFHWYKNDVQACFRKARNTLLDKVLPLGDTANPDDKESVCNDAGRSLDKQFGKDNNVFDQKGPIGIPNRLKRVGIPGCLRDEYKSLHIYYNASKHSDKPKFKRAYIKLGSSSGTRKAIRYFEIVRKILRWYYENKKQIIWDELDPIDYGYKF